MKVKLLEADADGRAPGTIVTMTDADAHQAAARGRVALLGEETIAVQFTQTVEPTAINPTRFDNGSVWHLPVSEAERVLDAGLAELMDDDAPRASQAFLEE